MRVAGVRLKGGGVAWIDAGDFPVEVLDTLEVRLGDDVWVGEVFVAPEQLLSSPISIQGHAIHRTPATVADGPCLHLPGGGLPPLGTVWGHPPARGLVVSVDPVRRVVTVRVEDGSETRVDANERAENTESGSRFEPKGGG